MTLTSTKNTGAEFQGYLPALLSETLSARKGMSKPTVTDNMFMEFQTEEWGGSCAASPCATDKSAKLFMYSKKDAAEKTSAAGLRNSFVVEAFTTNSEYMTAFRGKGEYAGGSWSASESLLNDYFITLTTKVAEW